MTKRDKVGLASILFVCWMLIQVIRTAIGGGEPYPAIKYPGFPGNGKDMLSSRELYQIKAGEERLYSHYQSVYGHARYRKLLTDICDAFDANDLKKLDMLKNGLMDIKGLMKGDTMEIIDIKWKATKNGYDEKSRKARRFVL